MVCSNPASPSEAHASYYPALTGVDQPLGRGPIPAASRLSSDARRSAPSCTGWRTNPGTLDRHFTGFRRKYTSPRNGECHLGSIREILTSRQFPTRRARPANGATVPPWKRTLMLSIGSGSQSERHRRWLSDKCSPHPQMISTVPLSSTSTEPRVSFVDPSQPRTSSQRHPRDSCTFVSAASWDSTPMPKRSATTKDCQHSTRIVAFRGLKHPQTHLWPRSSQFACCRSSPAGSRFAVISRAIPPQYSPTSPARRSPS